MLKRRTLSLALALSATAALALPAHAQEVYIPLISKGFQHQFWQAVRQGAEQAAKDLKVKVSFEGPESEAMSRPAMPQMAPLSEYTTIFQKSTLTPDSRTASSLLPSAKV